MDPTAPPEGRERVARRLRELERLGLVTSEAPGRWNVPGDLLEQLDARHRAQPARHRLWMNKLPLSLDAQVHHVGPVWLDQVNSSSLAPFGFGAEVGRAVEQRHEVLRALGIAPDDPRRAAKLRGLERRAVGEAIAAQTGQKYLAQVPERFRGRVQVGPVGSPYLAVTDGTRFVLVPTTSGGRDLAGKAVEVSRDAQGRLGLQSPDRGRDR